MMLGKEPTIPPKAAPIWSLLSKASATLDAISVALNFLGSALIVAVVVMVNADVFGRNVLHQPIKGVTELVTLSIVVIVFLQVSHAFRYEHLPRTFAILTIIENRSIRARALLEFILCIGACMIVMQLILASWPLLFKAWTRNTYEGVIGNFTVAVWPVKCVILLGCCVLFGQIIMRGLFALHAAWFRLPLTNHRSHDQP